MKKNLLLYILLGFLVIMNGFFLFNHFSKSNQRGNQRGGPSNFIAQELDFDEAQMQQFEKMDVSHREKMKAIFNSLRESKDALFDKLSDETVSTAYIDSITTLIANKEKAKEMETFNFFMAVGKLCNENQKERFNSIVKDALRRQGSPGRNGPPGRPGDKHRPPPPRH